MPRFVASTLQAWRKITLRQWAWATAIALLLFLAHIVGVLPPVLRIVRNVVGPQPPPGRAAQWLGLAAVFLVAAYCFLLAISIAERGAARSASLQRYLIAGFAACGAAVLIEGLLYLLAPSLDPKITGLTLPMHGREVVGRAVWSAANLALSGGLALAVYVRFRSARFARERFNAMELERAAAGREILASRLAVMQARVEPLFLLSTLAHVEALYDCDPRSGDRMLDGLIEYLRAALPQLRSERSTLKQEAQLAESYLRIVQIRMGSRLDYRVDIPPELGECDFPPMVLLPLIDDALRCGIEPLPHGGSISITAAYAHGKRARVCICDSGLPMTARLTDNSSAGILQERLESLYGDTTSVELMANEPQGVIASIEIPLHDARADR